MRIASAGGILSSCPIPNRRGSSRKNYALVHPASVPSFANAKENLEQPGSFGLLYSRLETLRCLAEVHFRRSLNAASKGEALQANTELSGGELNEAERRCAEAAALIEPTESRVCQVWLGPLYLEVLLEQKKRAETRNDAVLAEQKGSEAKARLREYQELVLKCQSPRFTAEAERLAGLLANQLKVAQ